MKAKFISFFFILSIALYILAPNYYSFHFILGIFILYIVQLLLFYKIKHKTTYWEFDTIFLFVFTIASFAYPLLFYSEEDPFLPFKNLPFDINVISKAVAGSYVAVSSYVMGSICKKKGKQVLFNSEDLSVLSVRPILLIVILLSIGFILSGGVEYYQSVYNEEMKGTQESESGLMFQIKELLLTFTIVAFAIDFYNKSKNPNYSHNKILVLFVGLISVLMLYAGNRTFAMQLILPVSFLYSFHFYKISKVKFLIISFVGIVGMTTIGFLRSGIDESSLVLNIDNIVRDIVIPARNNYLVYEVVEQDGMSFGGNFFVGVIGIIPAFPRLLSLMGMNLYLLGSAEYFTEYTQATVDYKLPGLGTMLQADAYYAFGFVGIIFVFFVIGFATDKFFKDLKNGNYYSYAIYSCLMANSIFWIRGASTLPIKSILWSILVLYVYKLLRSKNEKNIILHTGA